MHTDHLITQLSDVFMTITILSNSLMDGHQLPAYLPKLRDRLVYHEYHARGRPMNQVLLNSLDLRQGIYRPGDKGSQTDSSSEDREEEIQRAAGPTNVDGSAIGLDLNQLTLDTLLVRISRLKHLDTYTNPVITLGRTTTSLFYWYVII